MKKKISKEFHQGTLIIINFFRDLGKTASSLSFSSDLVWGVHVHASVDTRNEGSSLSRLAPSVTRVVISLLVV